MDGESSISKRAIFLMAVLVTGAIAGAFIWLLLFIMNLGISAVWDRVPIYLGEFYPVIVCLIGGVVIGLFAERFGDYPDTLPQVMAKVKEDGRYEYHDLGAMSVGAILPLVFGGSVGPEAGLTGVIAAVCTWVGDRMRRLGRDIRDLTEVSVYAALSAIFSAPLFGLRDAKEFATVLNSCGRYDDADTGLSICCGDTDALKTAERNRAEHRRHISSAIAYVKDNHLIRERKFLQYFDAGDSMRETVVGIVAGMLLNTPECNPNLPIIAFVDAEDGVKVSSRANRALVDRGLNLSEIMKTASMIVGGAGGGHSVAAGATIPPDQKERFLDVVEDLVASQIV